MDSGGEFDDVTERFGPDPAAVTQVDRTVLLSSPDKTIPHQVQHETAGYTVPHEPYRSGDLEPPLSPIAGLPQRSPGQFGPPPGQALIPAQTQRSQTPAPSLRIGQGVPAPVRVARPRDRRTLARGGWGRATRILSGCLTVLIIAAVAWTGWQWWQRLHDKVAVVSVSVAPEQTINGKCDVEYDISGTIFTNGKPGTIAYEWLRSDGQRSGTLDQSVASGQKSTTVHLNWRFTGEGSTTAKATLHVLEPRQIDGSAQFRYSCR